MNNIDEDIGADGFIVFSQRSVRRGIDGIILCVTHKDYYNVDEDPSGTPVLAATWLPLVRTLDSNAYYLERAKRFLKHKAERIFKEATEDYLLFETLPKLWQIFDESTFK